MPDAARSPARAVPCASLERSERSVGRRRSGVGWALLLAAGLGCSRPLPDGDSAQARVYVSECGMCHPPVHPGLMTSAMWRIQVERMDELRARRGMPALAPSHRALILDYLEKNAG